MNKEQKKLIELRLIMPRELDVEIHKAEEGGYWAKVKNLPGCLTQGEDFVDLVEMVNDAVFTYFEVPANLRKSLGMYFPALPAKVRDVAQHRQIEQLVTNIIRSKKTVEFSRQ